MTSQGVYNILSGNNVFYTDRILVCATNDTSQQIQWNYQPNQDATVSEITELSNWDTMTGISTLKVMTLSQGYYMCEIVIGAESTTYTAAIFDPNVTVGKRSYVKTFLIYKRTCYCIFLQTFRCCYINFLIPILVPVVSE